MSGKADKTKENNPSINKRKETLREVSDIMTLASFVPGELSQTILMHPIFVSPCQQHIWQCHGATCPGEGSCATKEVATGQNWFPSQGHRERKCLGKGGNASCQTCSARLQLAVARI